MHLQTIVAITDFSAAAEQALDRAAMVAADHHARLRIHYGTDTPDPKFTDPHARLNSGRANWPGAMMLPSLPQGRAPATWWPMRWPQRREQICW